MAMKAYDEMNLSARKENYENKKKSLSSSLQTASANIQGFLRLKKRTSNLFRHRTNNQGHFIDLSHFNRIISVDNLALIAEVEGLVTYEALVTETLKYNCLPAIVPELKSITVGGAIAGLGAESSSFKYGWVHETVEEIEVLFSDGSVIKCTPENEHRDLFYSIPSSYGTLGYVLKAKIRLIPTKPFVKINRLKFSDPVEFFEELISLASSHRENEKITFVDGVSLDNNFYITLGEFVDQVPFTSNYKYMNIYYRSLPQKSEDYLTTSDYIWRWDSDWFWCSKYFFMENFFLRALLGKLLLKSTAYWKIMHFANTNSLAKKILQKGANKQETVIQDLQIPIENAVEFFNFFKNDIKINPMYICPIKINSKHSKFLFCDMQKDKWYINFGAYGDFIPSNKEIGYFNRRIEQKVKDCGGNKWLYSNVFYTETEFWDMFDQSTYLVLKNKYDPQGRLNNLYNKCVEKVV